MKRRSGKTHTVEEMARVDPTRNVRHAVRHLLPTRPEPLEHRRLARFLITLGATLVVAASLSAILGALGAPQTYVAIPALVWLCIFALGTPLAIMMFRRDLRYRKREAAEWKSDYRRQAIERLALDLAAGRVPEGLQPPELMALDSVAADWRLAREALEAMSFSDGEASMLRHYLKEQADEAMRNILAEAARGSTIGPSPFMLERAQRLFAEMCGEAAALSRLNVRPVSPPTDESLEELQRGLARLREFRESQEDVRIRGL